MSVLHLVGPFILRNRLHKGKEHPDRWREKLAEPSAQRPDGRLVWLHAVGLGETLALRGLIAMMLQDRPDQHFLITSGTRASGEVLAQNMPPQTVHQFLPLDTPRLARKFLDHWRPDASIWAEQEVWPCFASEAARRDIPLAMVNARISATSYEKRKKAARLYQSILSPFTVISAQDTQTGAYLGRLGAPDPISIDGSLKPVSPPLVADPVTLNHAKKLTSGRALLVVAPSHTSDEAIALSALKEIREHYPDLCLILVPRDPNRRSDIEKMVQGADHTVAHIAEAPNQTDVIIDDRFGTLGAWYRLSDWALIGGGFSEVQGHNPWEAITLNCAVLHGPNVENFARDYSELDATGGAICVETASGLAVALRKHASKDQVSAAQTLIEQHHKRISGLAQRLNQL